MSRYVMILFTSSEGDRPSFVKHIGGIAQLDHLRHGNSMYSCLSHANQELAKDVPGQAERFKSLGK